MGDDKKAKEMYEALSTALKELLSSPEIADSFKCPLGMAVAEMRENRLRDKKEIETLKTAKIRHEQDIAILEKEKGRMRDDLEKCENARSKMQSKEELIRNEYEKGLIQIQAKTSQFEDTLKQASQNYSDFVLQLTQTIQSSLRSSLAYDSTYAVGAFKLAEEILSQITPLLRDRSLSRDKTLDEVKSFYRQVNEYVSGNERYDRRIPRKFLKVVGDLIEKAEQARKDENIDLAVGYRNSANALITAIKGLYEDPEIISLLGAFVGR